MGFECVFVEHFLSLVCTNVSAEVCMCACVFSLNSPVWILRSPLSRVHSSGLRLSFTLVHTHAHTHSHHAIYKSKYPESLFSCQILQFEDTNSEEAASLGRLL